MIRKFGVGLVAALSLIGLAGGITTAGAAEPGQPCTLNYGPNDEIVARGATDCSVAYASLSDALAAGQAAKAAGYVVYLDGETGSPFTVYPFVGVDGADEYVVHAATTVVDPGTIGIYFG